MLNAEIVKSRGILPVYSRLGLSKEDFRILLNRLYFDQKLSQQKIAKLLNMHDDIVYKYFKKYNIKTRSLSESRLNSVKHLNMPQLQKEIFDGILLADGHIDSNKSLISARLTYGCKYLETLIDIVEIFKSEMEFGPIWCAKDGNFHIKSHTYNELLNERKRWYADKKIVPKDVKLTPASCYWWYVGDGYKADYGCVLCTDAFDDVNRTILVSKLKDINFNSHITPTGGRIRIEGKDATRFLNWIGDNYQISEQYKYKWNNSRRMSGILKRR